MPQSANKQRNNAYYFGTYNGSSSPALPYPASVASCQAWGAANGLNVVGIEYGGECYGCAGCNYAVDGKNATNCTVDIGCSTSLQIWTLSAVAAVASPPPPPPPVSALSPPPPSSPPAFEPVQAASVSFLPGDETHSVSQTFCSTLTSFASVKPGVTSWRGNTMVITAGVSGYFIQGACHCVFFRFG